MSAGDVFDPHDPTGWSQAFHKEREEASGQTLYMVATGPQLGTIGTADELAGETIVQEDTDYDPAQYPDLSRFLTPVYGQRHVPKLSNPQAWL